MDVTEGADPQEDQEVLFQERISAIGGEETPEDCVEVLHASHTEDTVQNEDTFSNKSSVVLEDESDHQN